MGAHDEKHAGRALQPLDEATARAMTAGIRDAITDVRRSVTVLAQRVHAAHQARVWVALGYGSWAAYAKAEFGIGRAQAYRLIDISRAAGAITTAVAALDAVSPTGDTSPGLLLEAYPAGICAPPTPGSTPSWPC